MDLSNLRDTIDQITAAPDTIKRHFTILYVGLFITLALTLFCLFRKK